MAWVTRGGRGYEYRSIRVGGKVTSRYVGDSATSVDTAGFFAWLDRGRAAERRADRAAWDEERAVLIEAERRAIEVDAGYGRVAEAAMFAAGFHKPKRDRWRRRMTMASREGTGAGKPPVMTEADMLALLARIDAAEGAEKQAARREAYEVCKILAEAAQDGDESALPALRLVLARKPDYFGPLGIFDFAAKAMAMSSAGSKDVMLREVHIKEINALRDELAGPDPSPLDRLLCGRLVLAWFDANQRDIAAVEDAMKGQTLEKAEFHSRQRSRANARFLVAARSLATVRRMALPILHVHRDANPPAPAAPPELRVVGDGPN